MAKLIEFEGIDGSGKGTQAAALVERLQAEGLTVRLISFPRYTSTRFGRVIGDFLNGRFGELNQVSPWLAAVLYAGDRFESLSVLREARAPAHHALDHAERDALVRWIDEVEHDVFGLPRADLVILLDVPVDASQALIARKPARDYTRKAADLQESNRDYLSAVREFYRSLAGDGNWQIIECVQDGEIRSIEAVSAEVRDIIRRELGL